MKSGVYKIVNLFNGKIYIGSTKNLDRRSKEHFHDLERSKHSNIKLQNAFNKYGRNCFVFEVIEECHIDVLFDREQFYLDTLKPYDNLGYNIARTVGGGDLLSNHPMRDLLVEKRTKTLDTYRNSEQGIALARNRFMGANNPRYGMTLSDEEKVRLTQSRNHLKGTTRPDSVKEKVSSSLCKYHASLTPEEKEEKAKLHSERIKALNAKLRSLPVTVNDVDYDSVTRASEILNIPSGRILRYARSGINGYKIDFPKK